MGGFAQFALRPGRCVIKQAISIQNTARGTVKTMLLDRETCRLSIRQSRECFQDLTIPGFQPAGMLGEHPLIQEPPECPGEKYQVVRVGEPEGGMSNFYFVPTTAVESLLERFGVTQEAAAR